MVMVVVVVFDLIQVFSILYLFEQEEKKIYERIKELSQ